MMLRQPWSAARVPALRRRLALVRVAFASFLVVFLALPSAATAAVQVELAVSIAVENAALNTQIAAATAALERAQADLARLRKTQNELAQSMQRISRHAQVSALGRVFAQTVVGQMRVLPRAERFDAERRQRQGQLEATSDASLRVERALDERADLETVVATLFAETKPPLPNALWPQFKAAAWELLSDQRVLLLRLGEVQRKLLRALEEANAADVELAGRVREARAELTRLLFWVPARPGYETLHELAPAMAWMTSAANWRAAADVVRDEVVSRPFWPALALLVAGGLYFGRRRLQARLVVLAPAAANYERYWIGYTVTALAITLALALPGPLVMWTVAKLLATAPAAPLFPLALSDALAASARLLVALSAFAWLLERRGVAGGHFGWNESALSFTSGLLRRFTLFFVPLMLIAALNGLDHAPYANRESLGRMIFTLAMIVLAVFLVRLLRRNSPLIQRLHAQAPHSWTVRLYTLWFSAVLAIPLGISALAAAGYFIAAGYFFGRTIVSLFMVLGAVALYGVIALWVQVGRARLAQRQAEENAEIEAEAEPAAGEEAGSEIAEARAPELDIAAIGEQTRSLLDLFITLLLLGGLWWVWKDSVPALSVISDYTLWTYSATVDGKAASLPLTVGNLFLALIVGGVTTVAVRNVGALLDILLLQRFEMQADATYAIKVMTQYALAGAGIVVASNILGIAWGDVSWLIAALGVGLGFGLQEIVANFVSGLIVLAERPIRLGDIVTVGDVTGTVARIRARATAVVDFDGKEVIIPNKAFITGSVVNWTLSNQTTRLLLRVGVAYGSDLALVQRVLLDAVRQNDGVLAEPSSSVFCVGFGDSSINFEIRAFVDSYDKRLRVQHELNVAIEAVLREYGIEIPFPQRDLHLRSAAGLGGTPGLDPGYEAGGSSGAAEHRSPRSTSSSP